MCAHNFVNVMLNRPNKLIVLQYYCTYIHISRLTVVSREAKEEVPCDGLSTNAREYIYKNKPC